MTQAEAIQQGLDHLEAGGTLHVFGPPEDLGPGPSCFVAPYIPGQHQVVYHPAAIVCEAGFWICPDCGRTDGPEA